ncbi:hypothetical protein BH20ACT2_BH20ACT2_21450 [soil metagenome]
MRSPSLRTAMILVGVLVAVWASLATDARSTYGAQLSADEPQYVLSAISLAEDRSLDISDELAERRWRAFHEAPLPRQTEPYDDGRELSPHDPLLPLLLAVPVAVGGWVGAKLALAALAGALAAALMWVAVRRFAVPTGVAAGVVLAFGAAAPLVAYGTQIYPELPAALAVTGAVAALTGPLRARGLVLLVAAVLALPWLAAKYVPVAAALAVVGLVALWRRGDRRALLGTVAVLALGGVAYLAVHQAIYEGWTVYAAGDHFVGGEATVMGVSPDYPSRTGRLYGLLVDRGFGLVAWAPVFLLALPALGALGLRRPVGWVALALPLAAGWLTATFAALTMHGYWWPGRQVVVVVPLVVLAVAWWAGRVAAARPWLGVAGVLGAGTWAWVVAEVHLGRLALMIDFERTTAPTWRLWRLVLPDHRNPDQLTPFLDAAWLLVLGALVVVGWRTVRAAPGGARSAPTSTTDPDSGADPAPDHAAPTGGRRTVPA